jgi:signal transduction histidine kinase
MNILNNAIDALEDAISNKQLTLKNPTIHIRTELANGDKLQISIADNGVGMNAVVQKKIFDPFFTTKPVGRGTGLGLSISYQVIVEKHQGLLTCNSVLGKGTEFVIEIPLTQS